MATAPRRRSQRVDLQMTPRAKQTLQQATYETLADLRVFLLKEEEWDAFTAGLDAPPAYNDRLGALFARTPAWEP